MSNEAVPYRKSHAAPGYGQRYDANYASGYYSALYREIEIPMLEKLFAELAIGRRSLLDFACGTARVTQLAAPCFERVVGVDISEAMLENARPQVPSATFVHQDITAQPLDEKFDVVTAFRFFLNAEEPLRRDALRAIHGQLNEGGKLVCNIHMNRYSIMGCVYGAIAAVTGRIKHNVLSRAEFERTLLESGFEIERVIWYGVTPRPGRMLSAFFDRAVGPIERFATRIGLNGRFAHSFLIVARPVRVAG